MIEKIAGKHQATPIKQRSKNNDRITDKKAMADLLAETFSKNSLNQKGKQEFIIAKQNAENRLVGWGWRIHRLHLYRVENPPLNEAICWPWVVIRNA